ncbi:alkaline phosphatase family protein [Candidatus Omnitrophota bacterium]
MHILLDLNIGSLLGYIDPGTGFTIFSLGAWFIAFLLGSLGIFSIFFKKIFKFFKKYGRLIAVIITVLIALGLIIKGVVMNKRGSAFDGKIIILGFDGLSPAILEPMMKDGKLPNFAKLQEQGSYRRLGTTNPSQSPVAWSGFATGKNPGKNGVFDFIVRDPNTYGLSLSLSNITGGKPKKVVKERSFWQYTSDEKIPTIILGHPVTFPPDKIYGKMLSGMGVTDILGTEGTFSFYTTESLGEEKDIGGKVFEIKRSPTMIINLIGPKKATAHKKAKNIEVPVEVKLEKTGVTIKYQQEEFFLSKGQWSEWKEVKFNLGLFKNIRGIFKFYLIENEPEFKLYISPINFDPRDPYFQISYPSSYSKELAKEIGLFYTQGMPMDTWAVNEKRLSEEPFIQQMEEVLREKKAMLDFEMARFDHGLLFCYFESSDIVQHMFWRYTDPDHPLYEEGAPQKYKGLIKAWYEKMDSILGEAMNAISEDDTIIVISDHGFNTFRRAAHINSWLRKNGYQVLKDPSIEEGQELLQDILWSKTKAYSIGFGAIYINQKGREKYGIVNPGSETEKLKDDISQGLSEWIDEKNSRKIVHKVYSNEEIFWGQYANNAPDIYIGFNVGYRASWQSALGAAPKELVEDNLKKWSGSHLFDPALIPGIIVTNKKITKDDPSLYDITPTLLKIIGYSQEKIKENDFDGLPLF